MNSHQRRKDRKLWRYRIETSYVYAGGDAQARYDEIWAWLKKNFGDNANSCGWRERGYGEIWEFNCAKKAAAFALPWGGK